MGKKTTTKREAATVRAARAALIKRIKAIGAERTALRAIRDDIDDLITSCEDGIEALDAAIEALSRYA